MQIFVNTFFVAKTRIRYFKMPHLFIPKKIIKNANK